MTAIRPPGASHLTAACEPALEHLELVVDLDPQRLERALGRDAARSGAPTAGIAALMTSTSSPVVASGRRARAATMNAAMREAHRSSPYSRMIRARSAS